ncbi:MAG TPA: HIRAN domain-containing protein [Novimethylophilus sp.]|uniref:HIRAN domain-containing protein n=1 Tax=Novimethylophilus sp. TaxID=2137426 RepID=UPI002F414F1E
MTALAGGIALPGAAHASRETWKTLQTSPVAGFQYHHGDALWPQLAVGQPITLTREADNPYDERAVRVEWQSFKLGYIPRLDNAAISQLLDRGETLDALIVGLENSSNSWDRVKVEVRWRM